MMKKTILYSLLMTLFLVSCTNDKGEYDTRAIESIDKMSETISNLTACSYTLNTFIVKSDSTEIYNLNDVYMRGPDKMYINTDGTKGEKGYWYNGKKFAYYNYVTDEYDIIDAPDNIIKLIDGAHTNYGIDFPAGDFFYPSLTDDIIDNYDSVLYVGDVQVDETATISIIASNDSETLQLWISKETNLPYKMVLESSLNESSHYESTFSNWRTNQTLPDILFEFEPSENSTRVALKSKK